MFTVTVVAYNRPDYLRQCLEALVRVQDIGKVFDALVVSVEPGCHETVQVARDYVNRIQSKKIIAEAGVIERDTLAGVAEHPLKALGLAFDVLGSEANLAIEDDAVLSPDAALLARWFFQLKNQDIAWLSLSNHQRQKTLDNQRHLILGNPCAIRFDDKITSPFAWAMTRENWPVVRGFWNCKRRHPVGWDYSFTYVMRHIRKLGLSPLLSRCQNIGREGGVHESPESFDKTQIGLNYSDGSETDYFLSEGPSEAMLDFHFDQWMMDEFLRIGEVRD